MDPKTGRMKVRMVDIDSDRYKIARSYMLRLKQQDFEDKMELARLSQTANMTPLEFMGKFGYLGEHDRHVSMPPPSEPALPR
jgi:6-phosphofructokinase 1